MATLKSPTLGFRLGNEFTADLNNSELGSGNYLRHVIHNGRCCLPGNSNGEDSLGLGVLEFPRLCD